MNNTWIGVIDYGGGEKIIKKRVFEGITDSSVYGFVGDSYT